MPGVGTTHHIKLAGNYYLIRPGTYRKRPGPLFGARFTSGDPDFNNLSFWQHWAQTCWVGGFGAETWMDDAMFDQGVGIDSTQHEVMVLARGLTPQSARGTGNWDLTEADGSRIRVFTVFNDKLYILSYGDPDLTPPSRLFRWNTGTNAWDLLKTFAENVRSMEPFGGYLVFGDGGSTLNRMDTSEVFTTFNKPAGVSDTPYTLKTYRGKLYAGFARNIWRLKSDFTWDGSTAFYTAEDVNYLFLSEIHLGQLYFASQNGHVLRTDGNNTFDIWQFDPGPVMSGMRSFDGRLFISATEPLDGTTAQQAVLYQFTGSAITELKRWGRVGYDVSTGRLRVIGRRLYFGAGCLLGNGNSTGFGISTYDPVEDSYHMWSTCVDGTTFPGGTEGVNWTVDDVIYYRGYVWCSVRGYGVFRTAFSYKDVSRYQATYDTSGAGTLGVTQNGGWYETSDFDGGTAGLLKLWNAITVHIDLPNASTSYVLDYTTDGGITWVNVGYEQGDGVTIRRQKEWKLGTGTPKVGIKSARLKYRITMRTTDTTRSPQLRGVIVRYLPLPEPNWQWDFTLIVSESQHLLDDTIEELNSAALASRIQSIENAFRLQVPVNFVDVDGSQWTISDGAGVLVMNMTKEHGVIGPSTDGGLEAYISVTLLEAVEAY